MVRMTPLLVSLAALGVFLFFQASGISAGDSGDLVTAAYLGGVPHPPGYPLYTFLGWLLSKLPLGTIAWRVALLSSIPHAAVLVLVAATVKRLTKSAPAAVISSLMLLANYNFFHYSVTPEVFGLLDAFVASIVYLLVCLLERFRWRLLWVLAFVFGLSLAHHHVILFLLPALLYWAVTERIRIVSDRRRLLISLAFFLAGLLPYVYIPIAARGSSMINWDRAVDVWHLIRLVTRRDYGTFVSGAAFAPGFVSRLLALKAYAYFLILDFGSLLVLAIVGCFSLRRSNRRAAMLLGIAFLFLGPIFFFYASFPLTNTFSLGTYERFLLPSYLIVAMWAGLGAYSLFRMIRHRTLRVIATMLVFALVGNALFQTLFRFWGLREDKTAEYLAKDILGSVPNNAIVLLAFDTPLFTSQYVRYALEFRPDVRLVHASRLNSPDYQTVLNVRFPELIVATDAGSAFAGTFVQDNVHTAAVFTNVPFPVGAAWYWVPHGLLYQAVRRDALPTVEAMYEKNRALWQTFHDPKSGILSSYPHLMLADVLNHYAEGRLALGRALLRAAKFQEAEEEFDQAVSLGGDTKEVDALLLLGIAQSYQKKCDKALASFDKAHEISIVADKRILLFASFTQRDCLGETTKADELFSQYEELQRVEDIPLDQL